MTRAAVRAAERRKSTAPVTPYENGLMAGRYYGAIAERRRIRRELLNSSAMRKGVWVYAASVVEAIKKATRGTR